MENQIQGFINEFEIYRGNINLISEQSLQGAIPDDEAERIIGAVREYQNLDVKFRLALGLRDIRLNNMFVNNKQGDLKECHLLYYKLADLWYAYESFIKFDQFVSGVKKDKISWLDTDTYAVYANIPNVINGLNNFQEELEDGFLRPDKKYALIDYITYCRDEALGNGQINRLNQVILRLQNNQFNFNHTQVLTITYAVRNNFVHNGETTIVPDNFGYPNKRVLLKALYRYLAITLICSINRTCSNI